MKYKDFEDIISQERMHKYLLACNNESKRAMTLFQWMGIDANDLLYGIDHVGRECGKIMCI